MTTIPDASHKPLLLPSNHYEAPVAFSPNGRLIAAGGQGVIVLWNVNSLHDSSVIRFDAKNRTSWMAFTQDGSHVLATFTCDAEIGYGHGESVYMYDIHKGREIRRFKQNASLVQPSGASRDRPGFRMPGPRKLCACTLHRESGQLVVGSEGGEVWCWEHKDGTLQWNLRVYPEPPFTPHFKSIALSPDGRLLASCRDKDDDIRIIDTKAQKRVATMWGHTDTVTCVAFSTDGNLLASCSDDATVRIWDLATGKEVQRFEGHEADVNCVLFGPSGKEVFSGSLDGTVRVWDVESGAERRVLRHHQGFPRQRIHSLALSPNGEVLVVDRTSEGVFVWDLTADINDLDDAIRIEPPAVFAEIKAELSGPDDDDDEDEGPEPDEEPDGGTGKGVGEG